MNTNKHSFYRETKNSTNKNGLDFKSLLKKSKKYLKIFLYLFLTVTTLWGCVNQIRHHTSPLVSQGMEFYGKPETVLPNFFDTLETPYAYFLEGEETEEEEEKNLSFDFYAVNPNFQKEKTEEDGTITIDNNFFVKTSDYTDGDFNVVPQKMSYIISEINADASLLKYDWRGVDKNYDFINKTPNKWLIPWEFGFFPEEDKTRIWKYMFPDIALEEEQEIQTSFFYNTLFEKGFLSKNERDSLFSVSKPKFGTNKEARETTKPFGEVILIPDDSFDIETKNFEFNVIEKLDFSSSISKDKWNDDFTSSERVEYFNNASIYFTNKLAFLSYKEDKPSFNNFSDEVKFKIKDQELEESFSIKNILQKEFKMNLSLKGWNDSEILNDSQWENYSINFVPLDEESYTNTKVVKGNGYFVIPQQKTTPILPNKNYLLEVDKIRKSSNWESKFINTKVGSQERIDNAGWSLVSRNAGEKYWDGATLYDSEGNIKPLYANSKEEINQILNEEELKIEDKYNEDFTSPFSGDKNQYQLIQKNNDFIGMQCINDYFSSYDSKFKGSYSTFDDSIKSSGQDSNNSQRDIFTSNISDWGDAWAPEFGPLYGMFMWPLAQLSILFLNLFGFFNISPWVVIFEIFVITFLLRGLGTLMSLKSTKNQSKTQELQGQIAEINSKYAHYDKKNKQMKQKKQQEIMALYKKNEVNPFSSLGAIFVTMPIYLSLWTIISSITTYKIISVGSFIFSVSSFYGMFHIGAFFFVYLLVGISVGLIQSFSSKMPTWLSNKRKGIKRVSESTKKSMKKQNRTQNIMIGVFVFMGLTVPVLLAIYWIFSGLFTILLELLRHHSKQKNKNKTVKIKSTNKQINK